MSQANKIKESDYTSTPPAISAAPTQASLQASAGLPFLDWEVQEANPELADFLTETKIKPTAGSTARSQGRP